MRIFYLRNADPVLDYFQGRKKCPHKKTVTGLAKDCLPCLRALVAHANELPKHNAPIGCVATELDGDKINFSVSVCSNKDEWQRPLALLKATKRLQAHHFKGSVSKNVKPVKVEIMRRIIADEGIPSHARKAAKNWLRVQGQLHPEDRRAGV